MAGLGHHRRSLAPPIDTLLRQRSADRCSDGKVILRVSPMTRRPLYIGCACDRKFAEPTAVMLTSLDVNGDIPEAKVIVASFDLTVEDRAMVQAGAGQRPVVFLDITRERLHQIDPRRYTDEYPLPVLGRLFVAEAVTEQGARMVTLDSDMIINSSLRPLVDRDLGSEYFAAIHDPPRVEDRTYFNSGLTMFDVDRYKYHQVGLRSIRWLADTQHHPHFPDQEALNIIVGHSWHRLARTWNYFCYNDAGFTAEDLETCKVAHFAGPKPWDDPAHTARAQYDRYRGMLNDRVNAPPPKKRRFWR